MPELYSAGAEDLVKLLEFLDGLYHDGGPAVTGKVRFEDGRYIRLRFDDGFDAHYLEQ
jgi:hypothetical protein